MKESMTRSYCLAKELSQLFDLEGKIDTMLSVSMYYLNQFMDSERSSIWLFQHWNQQLTIFSSLDNDILTGRKSAFCESNMAKGSKFNPALPPKPPPRWGL